MQEVIEMTSTAADAVANSATVVAAGGELSRYAKLSQAAQQFASDNPIATAAIGTVAAIGVGYLAYKGVSAVINSCRGNNTTADE